MRLTTCCQRRQRRFEKQQPIVHLEWKSRQSLMSSMGWTSRGISLAVERAVVARTEKTIVVRFPMHTATQMRAYAGKSQKITGSRPLSLPRHDNTLARRCGEIHRRTRRKLIDLANKQPAAIAGLGWIDKAAEHERKRSVAARQPSRHRQ